MNHPLPTITSRAAYYGDKPLEHRLAPLTLRDGLAGVLGGTDGASGASDVVGFTGYASKFNAPYSVRDFLGEYTETIAPGAFDKALSERDDVRLLVNHQGIPLARTKSGTMALRSDHEGLLVDVPNLDGTSPLVQEVRSALRRGDVDEMSFAFKATRQEWNEDYTQRTIREVKLYDVSLVTYPANPAATVVSTHSAEPEEARAKVSHAPWDGSPGRFTDEQWHHSCIIKGDVHDKSTSHLPVREPDGTLNANGVHAAAGRVNQVHAAPSQIAAAKKELVSLYHELGEDPPDSLTRSAEDTARRMRLIRLRGGILQ